MNEMKNHNKIYGEMNYMRVYLMKMREYKVFIMKNV